VGRRIELTVGGPEIHSVALCGRREECVIENKQEKKRGDILHVFLLERQGENELVDDHVE